MTSFNDGIYVGNRYVSKRQQVNRLRIILLGWGLAWISIITGFWIIAVAINSSSTITVVFLLAVVIEAIVTNRFVVVRDRLFAIAPEYEHINQRDIRRARRVSLNNHDLPPPD